MYDGGLDFIKEKVPRGTIGRLCRCSPDHEQEIDEFVAVIELRLNSSLEHVRVRL